ncbi:MAG: histidine kinase dimerization/phospho-acceptor domain-containing protein, partial [Cyanobacteriota bacterium]|nr:histidine kinase dimerization/phospho-acceptor domain-containing protein [Cyanobacteriota bacterium]
MNTQSYRPPKLPKSLISLVWLICLLPFTLNLLGIDFASPKPPDLSLIQQTTQATQAREIMYRTLAGSFVHTILEWSAFCAAIFTVILSFANFKIKADVTTPILGVTLFCAGMMDAFHTLAADRLIEAVADNRNLIPFTWAICRLANALLTIIGISIFMFGKSKKINGNFSFVTLISFGFGLLSYTIISICATSGTLPQTQFPESLVTRPWDVLPLILFIISGFLIYPAFYKKYPSLFSHGLIISVIPNIATQAHMAFGSSTLFDNHFNIAHFLKIIAYLVPLSGLILDYVYTHNLLEQTNKEFLQEIVEREQAEAKLREFSQREDLLRSRLSSQITHSLELSSIFKSCVKEIYELLKLDYCSFSWYRRHNHTQDWDILYEEVKTPEFAICDKLNSTNDVDKFLEHLLKSDNQIIDNISETNESVVKNIFHPKNLNSVLSQNFINDSGDIGIILCACSNQRSWKQEEIDLIKQVKEQLIIALNQAQLYNKARTNEKQAQQALKDLQQVQTQLVQSEKMSALGNLVAGVAHEINNPVGFINGNLHHAEEYIQDLINHLKLYQQYYSEPKSEIEENAEDIDLDFLLEDLPKMIDSMKLGTDRIQNISTSLRTFSRADTDKKTIFDVHAGIDSTILILKHRLKANEKRPEIEIIKNYAALPEVEFFPGQLNQVFMNLLANAIDALDDYNQGRSFEEIKQQPNEI